MTTLARKDDLMPAFFQRVPGWVWLGWVIHLSSYTLPSFRIDAHQVASGFQCALIAFRMWFSEDGVLGELRNGKLEQVRGAALIGYEVKRAESASRSELGSAKLPKKSAGDCSFASPSRRFRRARVTGGRRRMIRLGGRAEQFAEDRL